MHIWVTPAEAWHFYWGNLTSLKILPSVPLQGPIVQEKKLGNFWLPVPLLLVLLLHTQTKAGVRGGCGW